MGSCTARRTMCHLPPACDPAITTGQALPPGLRCGLGQRVPGLGPRARQQPRSLEAALLRSRQHPVPGLAPAGSPARRCGGVRLDERLGAEIPVQVVASRGAGGGRHARHSIEEAAPLLSRAGDQRPCRAVLLDVPGYQPAAVQEVADTHDTPVSLLLVVPWFGLGTRDHAVPSHDSTRVLASREPTAVQAVADAHDTPFSPLSRPGLGLWTTD